MSSGPIEFLGEGPAHETPPGEFGGNDGLIQPEKPEVLTGDEAASGGHRWYDGIERETVAERSSVVARYAGQPLSASAAISGEDEDAGKVTDPITGVSHDAADLSTAGGAGAGELSSLKP